MMQRWDSDPLPFPHYADDGFARADLEFEDLEHDGASLTVLLYLNRAEVDEATGRDPAQGFAAAFTVFGHGDCWGDAGHCDIPEEPVHAFDKRAPHPLEAINISVNVTEALRLVREADEVVVTALVFGAKEEEGPELKFGRLTLAVYE